MGALVVNNNIMAINTGRLLKINNRGLGTNLERLSSGLRINRAADDPSGLEVSEGFRTEISGLVTGTRNAEHGTNLIQAAEGALNEVSAILLRMKELALQSASSTVNDGNREAINAEVVQLTTELDRIANSSIYNEQALLRGFGNTVSLDITASTALASTTTGVLDVKVTGAESGNYIFLDSDPTDNQITLGNGIATQTIDIGPALDIDAAGGVVATGSSIVANFDRLGVLVTLSGARPASLSDPATDGYRDGELDGLTLAVDGGTGGSIQVGADNRAVDRIELRINDLSAAGPTLGLGGVSMSTLESSRSAISVLDLAIETIAQTRGDLGAQQNRLAYTIRKNNIAIENMTASESSIRDTDVAEEVTTFTKNQVLVQSSTALLAQANAAPQNALSLLQ
ncbi:MAG: flagellin [Gemmatimonadetes bacterium]|nr:flagellin [Gemmatimonadota bacterium]|tara:strand:- start:6878 stop:8074 length:1197 start_codon:yes stop_codon:yes gene_type:complete